MATNTHITNLLPAYALGCLDEDELVLVSEHLANCFECHAELQNYQSIVNRLALTVPEISPPPALQRRLMRRIQVTGEKTAPSRPLVHAMRRTRPVWGWGGLIVVLVLAVSSFFLWQPLSQLVSPAQPNGMSTIPLTGSESVPEATGLIILSVDGEYGTLVVDHLPELDPDHQYQLWLIEDDDVRTSGAVFSVTDEGYGAIEISSSKPLNSYAAFGISVEPKGGSPGPTGENVCSGSLR